MKSPKKMSLIQIAKIKELHTEGLSSYAIAKKLSIPPGVARYHINRSILLKVTGNTATVSTKPGSPLVSCLQKQMERLEVRKEVLAEMIAEAQFH